MNVLLVYQKDSKDVDAAVLKLDEAGHTSHRASADSVIDGSARIDPVDVVIVFSEIYKENETYDVCRCLRETDMLRETPLLVAVNMYQMPLANRVKAMPNAHFVFTPVNADDLRKALRMLAEGSAEQRQ